MPPLFEALLELSPYVSAHDSYGRMPYRKMALKAVPKAVLQGERLDQPRECPEDVFEIMTK